MGWRVLSELRGYGRSDVARDLSSALTVTFMSVPQGVAYAMIAGLPPAMGLYAGCVPTIVGSLFRSSRQVITGPTNAVSLIVGTAGAAAAGLDPVPTALLLAFLVGAIQVSAGALRLGSIVDYISIPVVMGYITGAGILIGVGQLANLTETPGGSGTLWSKLGSWASHLDDANPWAIGAGAATGLVIVGLRKLDRRIPGAMIALALATFSSWLLDAGSFGLRRIGDLTPVPVGLPPLTLPSSEWSFAHWQTLLPIAFAATVLSLVESSAVARAISTRTGQRLDLSAEFLGQGLANLAAAFFGGYPTSGSPARSSVNYQSGARSRLAGVYSGLMMGVVLLGLGPVVSHTPIAALAGLLLVVALDLVDVKRIVMIVKTSRADAAAFAATLIGTWVFRLDHAIYVGVALSVVLFLRRARLLTIHHIVFDPEGRPFELRFDDDTHSDHECSAIRVLGVEGQLFFGAAGELAATLDPVIADERVRVILLRLRRAYGMDASIIQVLEAAAARLEAGGRHLMLVGVRPDAQRALTRTGLAATLGEDHLYPTTLKWFAAADEAMVRALELVEAHPCGECPLVRHLRASGGSQIRRRSRVSR